MQISVQLSLNTGYYMLIHTKHMIQTNTCSCVPGCGNLKMYADALRCTLIPLYMLTRLLKRTSVIGTYIPCFVMKGDFEKALWWRETLKKLYLLNNKLHNTKHFAHSCPVEDTHQKGVFTTQIPLQNIALWSAYNKNTFLQCQAPGSYTQEHSLAIW
jgi:hypothetical protein